MALVISDDVVTLGGRTFELQSFPPLLSSHLKNVEGTLTLETVGASLRDSGFAVEHDVGQFVRQVCRWGGYAGIGGRIINQNVLGHISYALSSACYCLAGDPPLVQHAMLSVNKIRQLGSISFASKHLRILRPDICPVLDSLLSKWLGYALTIRGYGQFAADTSQIARALDVRSIARPAVLGTGSWRSADVEMALFAHLRGLV